MPDLFGHDDLTTLNNIVLTAMLQEVCFINYDQLLFQQHYNTYCRHRTTILEFHWGILQLIWVGVNPKCIDDYAVLVMEWKISRICTYLLRNTRSTHTAKKIFPSDDRASSWSWPPVKLWRHVKPKNWLQNTHQHCQSTMAIVHFPSNALRSKIFKKSSGCLLKDGRKAGRPPPICSLSKISHHYRWSCVIFI